jgi:galactokinase/mevalonate kinase-like predicted kinase
VIGLRDLGGLADIIFESWQANIRIHSGTTNPEVEILLAETRRFYRGAKLLGAGGGGYMLFLSNSPREADLLRNLLQKRFENSKARIVDFTLNSDGLKVTVS